MSHPLGLALSIIGIFLVLAGLSVTHILGFQRFRKRPVPHAAGRSATFAGGLELAGAIVSGLGIHLMDPSADFFVFYWLIAGAVIALAVWIELFLRLRRWQWQDLRSAAAER